MWYARKEGNMRFFAIGLRGVAVCLLLLCTLLVSGNVTLAQTVSTSPTPPAVLAFGVPTGATSSGEQSVSITVTGASSDNSVTLSGFTSSDPTHFTITSNTCPTTAITASSSCSVGVTFTPPATLLPGNLYSGTFSFSSNVTDGPVSITLTGAVGAIKLFSEVDLGMSNSSASSSNPYPYGNQPLILSCPAGDGAPAVTAVLSNTPDGKGNVLEDNFITVAVGAGAPSNVCPAGIADPVNDCFTSAYQNYAGGSVNNGTNTDSITNPNNILVPGAIAAGGVSPINIASLFTFGSTSTPVTFKLNDEGV